jgi:hypothetical protein
MILFSSKKNCINFFIVIFNFKILKNLIFLFRIQFFFNYFNNKKYKN